MIRGRSAGRLLLLGILFLPATAQAHSPIKGAGDFINGLLHPLSTPTHILIIIGLGLLAGRQAARDLKAPLWTFAPLSALALALTTLGWIKEVYPPLLVCIALCAGVLLALGNIPPVSVVCVLFGGAALGLGLDSAAEAAGSASTIKSLLGNWISLNLLIFDLAFYVTLGGQAAWLKIALRVAGSWLIAISLMVLAFSFRS